MNEIFVERIVDLEFYHSIITHMKIKNTLSVLAAILASSVIGFSEESAPATNEVVEEKKLDYIEQNGTKFLHVSTLSTVEANREFMRNVQVIAQLRQTLIRLGEHRKIAFTEEERKVTDEKIKELTEQLNTGDQTMAKSYGYSLSRDYIHVPVVTYVYLKLTEEEYAKMKEEEKDLKVGEDFLVRDDDKYRRVAQITNEQGNAEFRRNVQSMMNWRNQLRQMDEVIKKMPEGEEKEKAKTQFSENEKQLIEANEKMVKAYGYSIARDYYMEVVKSKLYTKVTEEEFLRAEAQKALEDEALPADDASAKTVSEEAK